VHDILARQDLHPSLKQAQMRQAEANRSREAAKPPSAFCSRSLGEPSSPATSLSSSLVVCFCSSKSLLIASSLSLGLTFQSWVKQAQMRQAEVNRTAATSSQSCRLRLAHEALESQAAPPAR
jgi:predicted XRE-type DNA-binding protein